MSFKNMERYRTGGTRSRMKLAVPLPKTPDGRTYRYSPNETAHPRHFVIGGVEPDFAISDAARSRMKQDPRSPQTVCPYSGVIAPDDAFVHPDDEKAAVKTVEHAVLADVDEALNRMFRDMARSTAGSKHIKFEVKSSPRRRPKPRFGRSDLLRVLVCDHCGRDYGVYAIGLFCPDCGAPNLRLHFAREAELVGAQVDLAEAQAANRPELAYRILGNAHEDVLTGFEATQKAVYLYEVERRGPDAPGVKPVKNDFQNLDRARKRFADLALDPFAGLTPEEFEALSLNIQKRHVIGHNLSVVDAKFAELAGNARVGETVHLVGDDIRTFAAICQKVVDQLDAGLCGSPSPTGVQSTSGTASAATAQPTEWEKEEMQMSEQDLDVDLDLLARRVGRWLAENSENARRSLVDGELIHKAFPDEEKDALEIAIAELEAEGFVRTGPRGVGRKYPLVTPTIDLFATFDPIAIGSDPYADAVVLAKKVLELGQAVRVADLHRQTDWSLRRFNPAIELVVAQIDDRGVSKTNDLTYPTPYFSVAAADKVALSRFIKQLES